MLQKFRSLRRHKRQEHIETQPPGGTKRKSTTISTTGNNPRQDDPNASPPLKVRALQTNQYNKKVKSHNVETAKEVIEENYQENNVEEINKKIKQFEDTFKLMIKQKREDDKEKLILKADLMKGNARVANMTKDQESKGRKGRKGT